MDYETSYCDAQQQDGSQTWYGTNGVEDVFDFSQEQDTCSGGSNLAFAYGAGLGYLPPPVSYQSNAYQSQALNPMANPYESLDDSQIFRDHAVEDAAYMSNAAHDDSSVNQPLFSQSHGTSGSLSIEDRLSNLENLCHEPSVAIGDKIKELLNLFWTVQNTFVGSACGGTEEFLKKWAVLLAPLVTRAYYQDVLLPTIKRLCGFETMTRVTKVFQGFTFSDESLDLDVWNITRARIGEALNILPVASTSDLGEALFSDVEAGRTALSQAMLVAEVHTFDQPGSGEEVSDAERRQVEVLRWTIRNAIKEGEKALRSQADILEKLNSVCNNVEEESEQKSALMALQESCWKLQVRSAILDNATLDMIKYLEVDMDLSMFGTFSSNVSPIVPFHIPHNNGCMLFGAEHEEAEPLLGPLDPANCGWMMSESSEQCLLGYH
ncbi:hypothetical protein F4780DRAFT_758011 [Xylariomycetidae sp. FL0641]|nr:hypothetical protein F4780DRAFT_758011 [Xylariomycetidae sp. FL0641]